MPSTATRTETDSFGPIEVPADAYWGAQTERSIENFPFGPKRAAAGRARPCTGVHQAGRRAGECADRRTRPEDRRGHPAGGRGSRSRRPRQPVPPSHLADRVGHPVEHERQRGDRRPRQRDSHRQARRQGAGPPQRPGQQEPVVERQLPDRDAHCRRPGCAHEAAPGAPDHARAPCRPGEALGLDRQDRPHAPARRDPADARAGILRLRRADLRLHRAGRKRTSARHAARAGRHGGRHWPERAQGLRGGFRKGSRGAHAAALHFGPKQVRGARRARHDGRAFGRAQRHRHRLHQDRERHPAARLRPALRTRRAEAAGERAGQLDHAGQGQSDAGRDADDARRAGRRQSRGGDDRRACRGTSSSTCSSR